MHGSIRAQQIMRRIDKRQMRKRLRKVAQMTFGGWVVFLGQKPNIVPQRQQPFEQLARVVISFLQNVIVSKPETARQKYALARRQAVGPCAGVIPQNKAVAQRLRSMAAKVPRMRGSDGGRKPTIGNQQQAGIERRGAIGLHKANFAADRIPFRRPAVDGVAEYRANARPARPGQTPRRSG